MRRLLRRGLALLALTVALAGAGLAWLLGTEAGMQWALARSVGASDGRLQAEGARGTLLGGVAVRSLVYADGDVSARASDAFVQARLLPWLSGRIGLETVRAATLRVELGDSGGPQGAPPAVLPFAVRISELSIARLELHRAGQDAVFSAVRLSRAAIGPRRLQATGALDWPQRELSARFEVEGTLAGFDVLVETQVAGIPAKLRLTLAPGADRPLRALDAQAGPADPSRLQTGLPRAELNAVLKAQATSAGYEGELVLENAAPAPLDAGGVPVLAVHARFASRDLQRAELSRLRVALAGGGMLEGSGSVDRERLRAKVVARGLDLRALRSNLRRTNLQGPLALDAARDTQAVEGTLSQDGLSVAARVARTADIVEIDELVARASGGEIRGHAWLRLGETPALRARLAFAGFDPAAFGDFPRGTLNGNLEADGALGETPRIDARWRIEHSRLLDLPLASRGSARVARNRATRLDASATLGGARLSARGASDALAWTLEVEDLAAFATEVRGRLHAQGTFKGAWRDPVLAARARIQALRLPGDDVSRDAAATVEGRLARHVATLRLDAPQSRVRARLEGGWRAGLWQGEVSALENTGTYPLQLLAPAPLALARERVRLGRLEAKVAAGRLRLETLEWSPGRLATRGEVSGLPAAWVALAAGVAGHVRSSMLLGGRWAIEAAPVPHGTLHVARESGDLALRIDGEAVALEVSAARLEARLHARGVALDAQVRSRFGELALEGEVGHAPDAARFGPRSPLALRARLDSGGLRALTQSLITQARIDGRLSARLAVAGTLAEPRVTGEASGEDIAFEMTPWGVHLKDGRLDARLEGDRIRIAALSIRAVTGEFSAAGTLPLRLADGGAKLGWSARNFGVLNRRDLRLTVSGEGVAAYDGGKLVLNGDLRADHGYLLVSDDSLPHPGEDVVIVGQAPKPAAEPPALPLALDVQLDMGPDLTIETQTLEGRLDGRVRVTSVAGGGLRAHGRLRAVNAVFHAYGRRLQVDPGELIFDGPIDNPGLNITAWRRNLPVEAGVQVTGTARSPRVQLVSVPPASESERLSWLVLGRAPGDASRADLGLLQAAAGAFLARGSTLPADRRLARAFGFDELTLRGAGEAEGNVVAVGKRLSDRLYVSYEQGLGAVATSLVKLDYALGKRWSLRGEAGTTSGAGLFYRFAWD